MLARRFLLLLFAILLEVSARAAEQPQPVSRFVCRFARHPIVVDGRADEPAWGSADLIRNSANPGVAGSEDSPKARFLWDREKLYLFAEISDSEGSTAGENAVKKENKALELVFKPADDKPGYLRVEFDAAGKVQFSFWPGPDAEQGQGINQDVLGRIDCRVRSEAAGWTVEASIPWRGFLRAGGRPVVDEQWQLALVRGNAQKKPEAGKLREDYAVLRFQRPTSSPNDRIADDPVTALKTAMLNVEPRVLGSPDPPPPYRPRRVHQDLKLSFPIYFEAEPGTDRLVLIDQREAYGQARVCRTTESPGELATLHDFPGGGVAYSLTFHPKFVENGYLYVGWNGPQAGGAKYSRVTRFTIDRQPPHRLLPESALTIIDWPSAGHDGVAIAFGRDGMLYVTSGDGTSDSDTNVKGQGLDHLLAKVLRIDVDRPDPDRSYSIPQDNPFVGQDGVRPETWAYGFRNPWRISVDSQTGDVWVGNNGQDLWEQAYLVERGANYGWSVYEGSHLFYPNRRLGPTPVSKPTLEHSHAEARSLTGGVVYHGAKLPELRGAYIYGDYSTGKIWAAKVAQGKVTWHKEIADTTLQLTCFAIDHDGELLIADHRGAGQGGLYSLEPNDAGDRSTAFPRKLSETGLFASVEGHRVHPGLLPYSVNAPLWSDGAHKERFLFLPGSSSAGEEAVLTSFEFTSDDRGWNLPDGTIAVKSFALDHSAHRQWIETRLLVKQEGEWVGYSYAWNDQQNEATLVEAAGRDRTFELAQLDGAARKQVWHYPSRTECMVCHSRAANFVLGLSTVQFNRPCETAGSQLNQLEVLEGLDVLRVNWLAEQQAAIRQGMKQAGRSDEQVEKELKRLSDTSGQRAAKTSSLLYRRPDEYSKLVDPYNSAHDLTARAKSYLHSNCAQCHVEAGGGNAQIQLNWSTPLEKMKVVDLPPLHHTFGVAEPRLVAHGDPTRSVLLHRMSIRTAGQMPQLATNMVDERAVELLREWIKSLPADEQATESGKDSSPR